MPRAVGFFTHTHTFRKEFNLSCWSKWWNSPHEMEMMLLTSCFGEKCPTKKKKGATKIHPFLMNFAHPRCSCDIGKNATNVTNVTSNVTSAEMVLKEAEAQADEKRRWKLELALAMSIIETTANDTGTGTVVVNLRLAKTKTHKKKNMFFLSGAGFHPRWFSGNPLVIVTASLEINPALNVNFPALNLIHKFCCCGSCMFPSIFEMAPFTTRYAFEN